MAQVHPTDNSSPLVPLAIAATALITTVALVKLTSLGEGWKKWVTIGVGGGVTAFCTLGGLHVLSEGPDRDLPRPGPNWEPWRPPPRDPEVDPFEAFRAGIPAVVDLSGVRDVDERALVDLFAAEQPQVTEIAFPRGCRSGTIQSVVEKCHNLEKLDLSALASYSVSRWDLETLLGAAPKVGEVTLPDAWGIRSLSYLTLPRRVVFHVGAEEHIHCPWQVRFPPEQPLPAMVDFTSVSGLDDEALKRFFEREQPDVTELTLPEGILRPIDWVLKVIEKCPNLEKISVSQQLYKWDLEKIECSRELAIVHRDGAYRHTPLAARYPEGQALPAVLDLAGINAGLKGLKERLKQPQLQVTRILGVEGQIAMRELKEITKQCRNLQELDLTGQGYVSSRDVDEILEGAPKLTRLRVDCAKDHLESLKCQRALTLIQGEEEHKYFPAGALFENGLLPEHVDLSCLTVKVNNGVVQDLFKKGQPLVESVDLSGWRNVGLDSVRLVIERCPNLKVLKINGIYGSLEEAIRLELPNGLDLDRSISVSGQSFRDERDYKWQLEGREAHEIDLRAFPGLVKQRHLDALLDREPEKVTRICLAGALELSGDQILQIVKSCPNVQELDLTRCRQLRDEDLEAIAGVAKELRELNLTGCPRITNDGLLHLRDTGVEKLVLDDCSGLDGKWLVTALKRIQKLNSLSVFNVSQTDETFWAKLHTLPALRELGGEPKFHQEVRDEKIYTRIPAILGNGSELESLHLRCWDAQVRKAVIERPSQLKRIKIDRCMEAKDLEALETHAQRLEVLDLSSTALSFDQQQSKRILEAFPKLQELRLFWGLSVDHRVGREMFRAFVDSHPDLRVLKIGVHGLGDEDIDYLVAKCAHLEELELIGAEVSVECYQRVLNGLSKLRKLSLGSKGSKVRLAGSFPKMREVTLLGFLSGHIVGDLPQLFPAAHTITDRLGKRKLEAKKLDDLHSLTEEVEIFIGDGDSGKKRYKALLALKGPFPRVHRLEISHWEQEHQEGFEKLFELFPNLVTLEHKLCEVDLSKVPKSVILKKM